MDESDQPMMLYSLRSKLHVIAFGIGPVHAACAHLAVGELHEMQAHVDTT